MKRGLHCHGFIAYQYSYISSIMSLLFLHHKAGGMAGSQAPLNKQRPVPGAGDIGTGEVTLLDSLSRTLTCQELQPA